MTQQFSVAQPTYELIGRTLFGIEPDSPLV